MAGHQQVVVRGESIQHAASIRNLEDGAVKTVRILVLDVIFEVAFGDGHLLEAGIEFGQGHLATW